MPEYTYYSPMRPPTLGAVPKEGLLYVETFKERKYVHAIHRLAWGYAVYDRELAPQEIADHELIMHPREDEWD